MNKFEKIEDYLNDKTIVFFDNKGFIGLLKWVQSIYTKVAFKTKSEWTHIGIILDGYFYESTLNLNGEKYNEVIRTKVEDRFNEKELKRYNKLGFQFNFVELKEIDWKRIKKEAQEYILNDIDYAKKELFGTFFWMLKWRFSKPEKRRQLELSQNRFNTDNVYCIAYVADIMESNKKSLEYIDIEHSVSVVDEGWNDCKMSCANKIIPL
jgi:hypothetical protein